MSQLRTQFQRILAPDQILDNPADLAYYGHDVCKEFQANPSVILLPNQHPQVVDIMRECNSHQLHIVPSGGRTGYSGGATATAGEIILSLSRMNKIFEVNIIDRTLTCEAGATTEMVRRKALAHGLYYPVDFTSKGSSHIGGNIATNAGGIRVIRYGSTREWVLGLKVVTGSGEELNLNGSLYKNQSGYDLRNLIIGSEGTLGVITEVTLKLTSPPKDCLVLLAALSHANCALESLKRFRERLLTINVFEYFEHNGLELVREFSSRNSPFAQPHPAYLLIELERDTESTLTEVESVVEDLLRDNLLTDAVFGQNSKHNAQLFSFRELIGEAANQLRVPHKNDIAVPISRMPAFLDQLKIFLSTACPDYEVIIFGHVGDGNLHLNLLKPAQTSEEEFFSRCKQLDEKIFRLIESFGGSISAEHGIGLLKKPFLHFSRCPHEITLMQGVKRLFDPNGIINPGKIF